MRKTFFVFAGLAAVFATEAHARCNATVNGRMMSSQECEIARQIYGSYPRGRYLRDQQGNWVNVDNLSERGNVYYDTERGRARYNNESYWFRDDITDFFR